jgi:hypothetical protein
MPLESKSGERGNAGGCTRGAERGRLVAPPYRATQPELGGPP